MKKGIKKITASMLVGVLALSAPSVLFAQEETGTLRVGMECGNEPYSWAQTDDENGAVPIYDSEEYANGYDVRMAELICGEFGWNLEIVKLDWESLVPAVVSHTVDCVIDAQTVTVDGLEWVDFSEPYCYADAAVLTRTDSEYALAGGVKDLAGASCTSGEGTVWYEDCLMQIPEAEIGQAYESSGEMLEALEDGKFDLIVIDKPTAMAACEKYPDFVLLDFSESEDDFEVSGDEINLSISVGKDNAELLKAINSVLEGMTAEDYEQLMKEAVADIPLSDEEE